DGIGIRSPFLADSTLFLRTSLCTHAKWNRGRTIDCLLSSLPLMSARAIPRVARNALRSTRFLRESLAQPQQQRAFMNTLKNKGMRSYVGFADEASFRMGASMSRMSYMTRVEMGRLQVVLIFSLLSKSATVSQMIEDILKASSLSDEDDEGSGSRLLILDDV
ncbi:hypothetical protein WA577_003287, partial [Blastocystis sp. JDR]